MKKFKRSDEVKQNEKKFDEKDFIKFFNQMKVYASLLHNTVLLKSIIWLFYSEKEKKKRLKIFCDMIKSHFLLSSN